MAIQFACLSCRQPIEVDDELAGQRVTCPYCRSVVVAGPPPTDATAMPVSPPAIGQPPPVPAPFAAAPGFPPVPTGKPNWFASTSLICAIFGILSFCVMMGLLVPSLKKSMPQGGINQNNQKQFIEAFQKDITASGRVGALALTSIAYVVVVLSGVVFAILGLTQRQGRRWQAIVGLTVCGLMLMLSCLSYLSNLIAGAGTGA